MPLATATPNLLTRRHLMDAPPPLVPPAALPVDNPPTDSDLIPTDDGGFIVQHNETAKPKNTRHDANLANHMSDSELNTLAMDLLDGIESDIRSRREWESVFERGIDLLGLKMQEATSDVTSGGTVSKVYHPLMLEACIRYQSNFRAEMLPSNGPVKVKDDRPTDRPRPPHPSPTSPGQPPSQMGLGHNGGPPMPQMQQPPSGMGAQQPPQPGLAQPPPPARQSPDTEWPSRDELANAFEMDFNHYLTAVDKNFYPDTDRMSFSQALQGCAFKKIYRCPIRRRPVSIFVMATDLIVSNDASSLEDAQRKTHRIVMPKTTMARMKIAEVYRDVPLQQPQTVPTSPERKIKEVEGIQPISDRPEDQEYTVYECYVDLDLPGFEHKKNGKPTGLPLPYRVTIEKDSRVILEIRRNYKEKDKDFTARRRFVKYSLIPGLGFYDYGYIHILGNTTRALTAIERILIDAGMYNNFPGGLISKTGSRQETNQIRMAPGGWKTIDTGGLPINQVVMSLPYKEPSATLMALGQQISEDGRRLGMTADIQVGEGRADVPVGTTIALIEQATKVMNAVHKRNHTSQQEELELLRELFAEDPSVLWEFAKSPSRKWEVAEEFNDLTLVPASDPNVPSHVHRIMQTQALVQIAQSAPPGIFDNRRLAERVLRVMGIDDYQDLMMPPGSQTQQPDPKDQLAKANLQMKQMDIQSKSQQTQQQHQLRMQEIQMESQNSAAERDNNLQIANIGLEEQKLREAGQFHREILSSANNKAEQDRSMAHDQMTQARDHQHDRNQQAFDTMHDQIAQARDHEHQRKMPVAKPVKK